MHCYDTRSLMVSVTSTSVNFRESYSLGQPPWSSGLMGIHQTHRGKCHPARTLYFRESYSLVQPPWSSGLMEIHQTHRGQCHPARTLYLQRELLFGSASVVEWSNGSRIVPPDASLRWSSSAILLELFISERATLWVSLRGRVV